MFKSLGVGGVATIVSMGALYLLVEYAGMSAQWGNAISLPLGVIIQFVGNRFWAFDKAKGNPALQFPIFVGLEVTGIFINVGLFWVFTEKLAMHYMLARLIGTGLVFWCFSYPLWQLLFVGRKSST